MRRVSFALAFMVMLVFGGLVLESASAQNTNSSTTMTNSSTSTTGRRHRKHRKHRRHRRGSATTNKNANQ